MDSLALDTKIEVLEPTGIKHAPYGHMLQGEVVIVDRQFAQFACANGWAKHYPKEGEEAIPTAEQRGTMDRHDPSKWKPGDAPRSKAAPLEVGGTQHQ